MYNCIANNSGSSLSGPVIRMSSHSQVNLYSTVLKGGDPSVIIMTPHTTLLAAHSTIGPSNNDGIQMSSVGTSVYIEDSYIHRNNISGIHILPDFNISAHAPESLVSPHTNTSEVDNIPAVVALSNCDLRGNGTTILTPTDTTTTTATSSTAGVSGSNTLMYTRCCTGDDTTLNDLNRYKIWPKIRPLNSGSGSSTSSPRGGHNSDQTEKLTGNKRIFSIALSSDNATTTNSIANTNNTIITNSNKEVIVIDDSDSDDM